MERLISRISFGSSNPKDLVSLKQSLVEVPNIKELLKTTKSHLLKEISQISDLAEPKNIIEEAIKDEPNTSIREGNIIKKGYSKELDELRK